MRSTSAPDAVTDGTGRACPDCVPALSTGTRREKRTIPPLTAAVLSLILMPDSAPPIAFVAGVLGALVGADLLHLKDIGKIAVGMASIGGAGTFDGIVLGGLIAALLA